MPDAIANATPFIQSWEGFRSRPYQDSAGVWTIGYGSTTLGDGHAVSKHTAPITRMQATALLQAFLRKKVVPRMAMKDWWDKLSSAQQTALLSLAYNIGIGAFITSTVARLLASGDFAGVPKAIMLWDKVSVGGVLTVSAGLRRRRAAEAALFASTTGA